MQNRRRRAGLVCRPCRVYGATNDGSRAPAEMDPRVSARMECVWTVDDSCGWAEHPLCQRGMSLPGRLAGWRLLALFGNRCWLAKSGKFAPLVGSCMSFSIFILFSSRERQRRAT